MIWVRIQSDSLLIPASSQERTDRSELDHAMLLVGKNMRTGRFKHPEQMSGAVVFPGDVRESHNSDHTPPPPPPPPPAAAVRTDLQTSRRVHLEKRQDSSPHPEARPLHLSWLISHQFCIPDNCMPGGLQWLQYFTAIYPHHPRSV